MSDCDGQVRMELGGDLGGLRGYFAAGLTGGRASSYLMYCSRRDLSALTSIRPFTNTVGVLFTLKASPSARFRSTACFGSGDDIHALKAPVSSPADEANPTSFSQMFSVEIKS